MSPGLQSDNTADWGRIGATVAAWLIVMAALFGLPLKLRRGAPSSWTYGTIRWVSVTGPRRHVDPLKLGCTLGVAAIITAHCGAIMVRAGRQLNGSSYSANCGNCGYSLRGLAPGSMRCPECGASRWKPIIGRDSLAPWPTTIRRRELEEHEHGELGRTVVLMGLITIGVAVVGEAVVWVANTPRGFWESGGMRPSPWPGVIASTISIGAALTIAVAYVVVSIAVLRDKCR